MCKLFLLVQIAGRYGQAIVCEGRYARHFGGWPTVTLAHMNVDKADCLLEVGRGALGSTPLFVCGLCDSHFQSCGYKDTWF